MTTPLAGDVCAEVVVRRWIDDTGCEWVSAKVTADIGDLLIEARLTGDRGYHFTARADSGGESVTWNGRGPSLLDSFAGPPPDRKLEAWIAAHQGPLPSRELTAVVKALVSIAGTVLVAESGTLYPAFGGLTAEIAPLLTGGVGGAALLDYAATGQYRRTYRVRRDAASANNPFAPVPYAAEEVR